MRFSLRTLLIVMVLGPPALAAAWWYGKILLGLIALAVIACPPLVLEPAMLLCGYTFGALCHLIGRLPGGCDRKDPN